MDALTAAGHLERARTGIRAAMANWDASDLERIGNSSRMLSDAVEDMRLFESAARLGQIPVSQELYSTIVTVKQEISQATSVVDACVAFHRALAARMGEATSTYNAEGQFAEESTGLEPEVLA